jgi:hypothetical protein
LPRLDLSAPRPPPRETTVAWFVVLGALVLGLTLLGVFVWAPFQATHKEIDVRLNGVNLSISYVGDAPPFLGPAHQDICHQQDPVNSLLQCPVTLYGGGGFDLMILNFPIPQNVSRAFFNFSVSSPFAFFQTIGRTGDMAYSPTGNSSTVSFTDIGGAIDEWVVSIGLPSQPPALPHGFNLTANVIVQVV